MPIAASNSARFLGARERANLSEQEAADRMGISLASIGDLEAHDDELCSLYSPADVQKFSEVLGIRFTELLGVEEVGPAILPEDLAGLIRDHCHHHNRSIEEFEQITGWHVAKSLSVPRRFLQDYTIDGIQDICRELQVDWQRVVLGLLS